MADAPPPQLPQRPRSDRDDALAVLRRLREAGHVAYFAGGCVRDQLLGLEPKDWDVATDAPPNRVRQLFSNTQAVGAAFGVILVRHRKSVVEVATFRTDLEYKDGRRPEGVRFTTAEEDAKRRDFTINGLFQDPIEGRIIDYVGGQADLKDNVLRAIGDPDKRFEEDHLRLLRAVRFAARFGLTIEPWTADAIRRHASQLVRISPERIADELRRMLTARTRAAAWRLLWDCGLVAPMMRFTYPERKPVPLNAEVSVFLKLRPTHDEIPFALGLAAAVADYPWQHWVADEPQDADLLSTVASDAKGAARAIRRALRISNDELDALEGTLGGAFDFPRDFRGRTVASIKRFLARPTAASSMALMGAFVAVPGNHVRVVSEAIEALRPYIGADVAPLPLITGDDLTAAGLKPGPVFKRVLDAVYDAQLEDRARSKEEALGLAMTLAREGDETPGPSDRR